ncbi:hypothetical protein C1H46_008528 [Malus baccata]|uniref:Uncharacterized protein n=1 Tax=Malus baccata TaxID=106549 RepID=A0A540N479_MALBA|nr:hypothetical protein C1H46_008528 [Malus baccata]
MCSVYENPYESFLKFDHGGGSGGSYLDDRYGGYNRSRSDLGSDPYGKRYNAGPDAGMSTVFMLTEEVDQCPIWENYGGELEQDRPGSTQGRYARGRESGVQKFRVKLLAENGGQSTMDVLCQV